MPVLKSRTVYSALLTIVMAIAFSAEAKGAAKTVRVGVYQNKPKIFVDENGRPAGLFIELLEEIAAAEQWTLSYTPCEWTDCLAALERGQIDLMPDMAYSPERDERFDFHRMPVAESFSQVYARPRMKIDKISDLAGLRVAVLKDSIQQKAFENTMRGHHYDVTIVPTDTFETGFRLAAKGSVDAAIANKFFGNYFFQSYHLVKTPVVFNAVSLYYATAQGRNADLLETVDRYLEGWLKKPSVYYTILGRWTEQPMKLRLPGYIVWMFFMILSALLLSGAMLLLLRRQVRARTRHLDSANTRLRISETKYRRLHESMRDGFVYLDMRGRIRESNETYRQMLGYTVKELTGLRHIDLMPEKRHALHQDTVDRQVLTQGFSEVIETEYRNKDGTLFPVELRLFLIRNDFGEHEGMWAIVRDITERMRGEKERKKLQAQLIQAQKIESVGRLAGGVAHDFNNMLSVILGHTELAMGKIPQTQPVFDDLQAIQKAAERSADLTRQLLAFARRQTISPRGLDLNDIIESMLRMLRRLIGEDIDLVWRPDADLWPIKMDPAQIDQVLANLCVNARDAISGVGKITISTHNQTFEKFDCADGAGLMCGAFVLLSVSDNGCGMDRETIDKIFEPFFTTKETGRGTGLGLATVYGIVKQNSGFINVYSEPGKGTTFKIYLPRHEGQTEKTDVTESAAQIPIARGETVLLVEDDSAIMEMGRAMLEHLGYRVLKAGGPSEALRAAEEHTGPIDLLTTDVIMPEMNGRELAARIQALRPEIKILFMSGYPADVIAGRSVLDKNVHFIGKPFLLKDLAIKVREAMGDNPP